ncbi:hypothetical protein HMPREF3226_01786 [Prevotella corporis]|jgi:hypothetical protein|uniref:Uncharacterized protein n=1 Tax=Prevotella corporis TaxID=28128 RepID=A0A133Q2R1_9BACT|nr:hypothetical protein HMPREF3226_01786 [Prevotella corporis]
MKILWYKSITTKHIEDLHLFECVLTSFYLKDRTVFRKKAIGRA